MCVVRVVSVCRETVIVWRVKIEKSLDVRPEH